METDRFVVDSSVFVAFYVEGDEHHEDAVKILKAFEASLLVVHPFVIQEVVTVLTYRLGTKVSRRFLSDISQAENVSIVPVAIDEDMENFIRADKKMSFTDVVLVFLARRMNASLLTFDRQMLSLLKSKSGLF